MPTKKPVKKIVKKPAKAVVASCAVPCAGGCKCKGKFACLKKVIVLALVFILGVVAGNLCAKHRMAAHAAAEPARAQPTFEFDANGCLILSERMRQRFAENNMDYSCITREQLREWREQRREHAERMERGERRGPRNR